MTTKDMVYVLKKEVSLAIEGGFAHTTDPRKVLIFAVDMCFSFHKTNRANHIYVMRTDLIQGIHDTTLYAEKNFYRNFTDPSKNLC